MNKRALGCLAGLLAGVALPVMAAPQEVHFANWADYIGPTVLQDFQKETGIRVVLDAFESDMALRDMLGEEFVKVYLAMKRQETARLRDEIPAAELAEYFDLY